MRLSLEVASDFADQSETHDKRQQRGELAIGWKACGDAWEWRADYEAAQLLVADRNPRRARRRRVDNAVSLRGRDGVLAIGALLIALERFVLNAG